MKTDREAGIKWVDNPEWEQLHSMDLDMVKDFLEHKDVVPEAVGDAAESLYDLQDELGLEDNILVDELARYLDVDQIADFVAHFRRHHGIGEGDGRKRGIHPKGHPRRRAQQAAIHAEGKK